MSRGGRGAQRWRRGGTFRRRAGDRPVKIQHEKVEQSHIVQMARLVVVVDEATRMPALWETGRPRSRGSRCGKCGEFVPAPMHLNVTPGHADLVMVLRPRPNIDERPRLLYWETKAKGSDGRMNTTSREQDVFLRVMAATGAWVGSGDFDGFLGFLVEYGYIARDSVAHYRLSTPQQET